MVTPFVSISRVSKVVEKNIESTLLLPLIWAPFDGLSRQASLLHLQTNWSINVYMTAYKNANIKTKRSINSAGSPKRGRGRPREFDRDQGLEKAMQIFWSLGYDATSMADLRVGLGIMQASLYAAFGSKEQLFREAVDLYRRTAGLSTARALAVESSARE